MTIAGPAWDLSSEYASVEDPVLLADLAAFADHCAAAERDNPLLVAAIADPATDAAAEVVAAAQRTFAVLEDADRLLGNIRTYCSCRLSVNSADAEALALQGRLENLRKRLDTAAGPLELFSKLASDSSIEAYLADSRVAAARFEVTHDRKLRQRQLSLEEEQLASGLALNGLHAWNKLYTQLSGSLQAEVTVGNEQQTMGLANAAGLMQSTNDHTREQAWRATNQAWSGAAESCAAALNGIAGWRLDMNERRSKRSGETVGVLDTPLHLNRISRTTLDTLLAAAKDARPMARRVASLQAKAYGKSHFGPWDSRAPAPVAKGALDSGGIPFADGLALIRDACGAVDPALADFVQMMADRRWIEGTTGDRKRTGAYCTRFNKSGAPRVYMTYSGGTSDVITLAHELGHAFHNWVMRDLPESQRAYGMSLAETASTFCETLVRDTLMAKASSLQDEYNMLWEDVSSLPAFVLNIPARFQFEQMLYARRAEGPVQVPELKALMAQAWQDSYGDCLAEPDEMFWASKLHFYISEFGFYNFPYLFGYLFSLGVYAQRETLGADFFPAYQALLLDTGRMTAEELAAKHLGADLAQPAFWQASLAAVAPRVDRFDVLTTELGGN